MSPTTPTSIKRERPLRVVHIVASTAGGAGTAAYRQHLGLREIGVASTILTLQKTINDASILCLPLKNGMINASSALESAPLRRSWQETRARWKALAAGYPRRPPEAELFSDLQSAVDLLEVQEVIDADVVNLHWTAGAVDYASLTEIARSKPVVWTLHDMNPLTGGCHYTNGCDNYRQSCGACPQLGSDDESDLSRSQWQVRRETFAQGGITAASPRKWLASCASESGIMQGTDVVVIPYGVPLDVFRPMDRGTARHAFGIPHDTALVLFGADYGTPRKGLSDLVRALRIIASTPNLKPIVLGIFGDLPPASGIPGNIRVVPFGRIADPALLAGVYALADVCVLPSLEDNLPLVGQEALACGLPVAGSTAGGIPELVEHKKTGYLFAPLHESAMAEGILWTLSHRESLSGACRVFAEQNFDLKNQAGRYLELYERLANARPEPSPLAIAPFSLSTPAVSAIISAYQSERFMRGRLQNLVDQTLFAQGLLEIIVIDAHSPQNERAIVEEFAARYPNIRYIRCAERESVYASWNRGIGLARGRYVINANTDDRFTHDGLERLMSVLDEDRSAGAAYGDWLITREENDTCDSSNEKFLFRYPDFVPPLLLYYQISSHAAMYRRDIVTALGGFDGSFSVYGDRDFMFRFAVAGKKASHLSAVVGLYLENPSSVERTSPKADAEWKLLRRRYTSPEMLGRLFDVPHVPVGEELAGMYAAVAGMGYRWNLWGATPMSDLPFALEMLRSAFAFKQDDPAVLNNLGVLFCVEGRHHEALQAFGAASDLGSAGDTGAFAENMRQADLKAVAPSSYAWLRPRLHLGKGGDQQPLVSIVIPCHNGAAYLEEAVASVKAQTYESWEIVIVDDASDDSTPEVLDRLQSQWGEQRMRSIRLSRNAGQSHARNVGVANARGMYILPLDADDCIAPTMLEACMRELVRHPEAAFAYTDVQEFGETHRMIPSITFSLGELRTYNYICATGLVKTDCWRQVGGYNAEMRGNYEDWDFWLTLAERGYRGIRVPEPLLLYRKHQGTSYGKAASQDDQIKARMVFQHPALYGEWQRKWAAAVRAGTPLPGVTTTFACIPQPATKGASMTPKESHKGLPRILMTMYGWSESGGGTTYPREIARKLVREGYDVTVFYADLEDDPSQPAYTVRERVDEGVRLFGLINRPAKFTDPDHPEREVEDKGALAAFQSVLDRVSPNVVHFHNFHGLTFALAREVHQRGIPSCYTPHNYHMIDPDLYLIRQDLHLWRGVDLFANSLTVRRNRDRRQYYEERVRTTRRLLNEWVNITLAVSRRQRDLLIAHGASADRVTIVHQANPSADALWAHAAMAGQGSRPLHAPMRFGFIGGVMPHKGVHKIAAAAQEIDPAQAEFHIFGFVLEPYLQQLRSIDKEGRLIFHGPYTQDQLPAISQFLDVAIVPSVWEDCAPLVVLELEAMRLPVIGARIGGIPDFIDEGITGHLYQSDDVRALRDAVNACVRNPAGVLAMRSALKQSHSFARYLDHVKSLYGQLSARLPLSIEQVELVRGPDKPVNVMWEGSQFVRHSLALVNREQCLQLSRRSDVRLGLIPYEPDQFGVEEDFRFHALAERTNVRAEGPVDVHVRHQWPPNLTPPPEGHWVIIQPWEFGSMPAAWRDPFVSQVDEVWVPSAYVKECYVRGGVPGDRVQVIPNGVNTNKYKPGVTPYPLPTRKRWKFLFVGGTIPRKGVDILLQAYTSRFTSRDDVCLVIKDLGVDSFYRNINARESILRLRDEKDAPEVIYLDSLLTEDEMAGLYVAADCLVHPFRGEGFGLPVAEAMSCGLSVIVTDYGPVREYCTEERAYLIPAREVHGEARQVGTLETVDLPRWAEPDVTALGELLRHVAGHPEEARNKGRKARQYVKQHLTWEHSAEKVYHRLRLLARSPIRRFSHLTEEAGIGMGSTTPAPAEKRNAIQDLRTHVKAERWAEALSIAEELLGRNGPDDEVLSLALQARIAAGLRQPHAGRAGSISLCMIVKNEEQNLARCLRSALSAADEIVVVDTGSTDRTEEIAAAFGARVFSVAWQDDFATARNVSLEGATAEWILVLDSDEVLSPKDCDTIRELTGRGKGVAASFVTRNYIREMDIIGWTANDGVYAEEAGTGWIPSDKVRLFPNLREVRFENPVHELVEPSLQRCGIVVKPSGVPIHHYGKLDSVKTREKALAYLHLGRKKLSEKGLRDIGALYELAFQENDLGNYEESLKLYSRILELNSSIPRVHLGVGASLMALKKYERALEPLRRALELDRTCKEAYTQLAFALLYLNRLAEANDVAEQLHDLGIEYPPGTALLAALRFCKGDVAGGRRALEKLDRKKITYLEYFLEFGRHLVKEGKPDFAVRMLEPFAVMGEPSQEVALLLVDAYRALAISGRTIESVGREE